MKKYGISGFAFCMIAPLFIQFAWGAVNSGRLDRPQQDYKKLQLSYGAKKFPALAQLLYRDAQNKLEKGDRKTAEALLIRATQLDPDYPDAYFTLARLKAFKFDGEALFFVVKAAQSIVRDFQYQSLLLASAILNAVLLLILLSSMVAITMALKYLPFASHKIKEFLHTKFDAACPGFTAYLILLSPFAFFPGVITGFAIAIILTWMFLSRRERSLVTFLVALFALLGFFSPQLRVIATATNPKSLTSIVAEANQSPGDYSLIRSLERASAETPEMQTSKYLALGLLNLRDENFYSAADYLLKAISLDPSNSMAYINIGNVYYLQGEYEKALEGYRKAEALDSLNAVCQYNLAQAYIKTLLMAKSSIALKRASVSGIEKVKKSYSDEVLRRIQVHPATFENRDLWRLARAEGALAKNNFFLDAITPLTHFPPRPGSLILIGALLVAMIISRIIHPSQLTFQCSNCGKLTCSSCCDDDRGIILCRQCAATIESVSSEKVIDALLRQCRQGMVIKRRKSIRLLTMWIPGIRNIYYGKLFSGCMLAILFSLALIQIWARGLIIEDWNSLALETTRWKFTLPAAAIILTYAIAIFSKQTYTTRSGSVQAGRMTKDRTSGKEKGRKAVSF